MSNLLSGPGFLGTHASFRSDATLVLILITSVMFTIGWPLAVQKRYQAHRWVMTSSTFLNSLVVLGTMISSFVIYILPGIPAKFTEGSYMITTVHALVGTIGLALGVFVVLRGNELVPKRLRFKKYKRFMRTSYIIYMLATLLGVVVYVIVFIYGI